MFYSNKIFKGVVDNEDTVTFLIGMVNFFSSLVGLMLIGKFGRKTLMVVFNVVMFLDLAAVGIFQLNGQKDAMIGCLMLFIVSFEFSSGPIVWLYMSEIMCDKSQSVATVANWMMNLIISIITPTVVDAIGEEHIGYIFIICGGLTFIGTLFLVVYMKETMGKTPQEIEGLFYTERNKDFKTKKMENNLLNTD